MALEEPTKAHTHTHLRSSDLLLGLLQLGDLLEQALLPLDRHLAFVFLTFMFLRTYENPYVVRTPLVEKQIPYFVRKSILFIRRSPQGAGQVAIIPILPESITGNRLSSYLDVSLSLYIYIYIYVYILYIYIYRERDVYIYICYDIITGRRLSSATLKLVSWRFTHTN